MVRRLRGNPSVPAWEGSEEQRAAREAAEARKREARRRAAVALAAADFSQPGADTPAVRRLAELNAEYLGDLGHLADKLNEEGHATPAGAPWNYTDVAMYIGMLWPHEGYASWNKADGTYPGYLGGLRDAGYSTVVGGADDRVGRPTSQVTCLRCDAQWPQGWPGTIEPGESWTSGQHCPDCGGPNISYTVGARMHSIIDMHWMLFRHAPVYPGPCPVCDAPRELSACGYPGTTRRILTWHCSRTHHSAAAAPVEWHHLGDADAYWLASDLLRMAAAAGEVTELPPGATYECLDGTDERWTYDGPATGWRPAAAPEAGSRS